MYLLWYVLGVAVRLVGSNSSHEGRVEVNYNGEWGTVCDDGWDDTDAGVVCKQLGFGSSGIATGSADFGQASGPTLLGGIMCIGNEATLARCAHYGINITRNCSILEAAGVKCSTRKGQYSLIRCTYSPSLHIKV